MTTDTFTNVWGRRVVAADTAESIGSVKAFMLDDAGRRVEAIHVDGDGKRTVILDWATVTAFGADAVMANAVPDPSPTDTGHQVAAVKGVVTMIGARVLTVGGHDIGIVTDVEFDTGTGAVVRVVTDQGPIDGERLRALGSYALVVDDAMSPTGR